MQKIGFEFDKGFFAKIVADKAQIGHTSMSLIKGSIFGIYVGLTKFHVRVDFFGRSKIFLRPPEKVNPQIKFG